MTGNQRAHSGEVISSGTLAQRLEPKFSGEQGQTPKEDIHPQLFSECPPFSSGARMWESFFQWLSNEFKLVQNWKTNLKNTCHTFKELEAQGYCNLKN